MPLSVGERLVKFLDYKKLSIADLTKALGYQNNSGKIYRIVQEKDAAPGYDTISDIAKKYPELNIEWWLFGRGDMLKSDAETISDALYISNSAIPAEEKIAIITRMLKSAREENERLREQLSLFSRVLEFEQSRT